MFTLLHRPYLQEMTTHQYINTLLFPLHTSLDTHVTLYIHQMCGTKKKKYPCYPLHTPNVWNQKKKYPCYPLHTPCYPLHTPKVWNQKKINDYQNEGTMVQFNDSLKTQWIAVECERAANSNNQKEHLNVWHYQRIVEH
jgi:hypothetical protein